MKRLSAAGSRTPLILLGATVLLVVVALIVVFTRGAAAPVDPASPEGVVQSYVTAVLAGNEQEAAALLTTEAVKDCHVGDVFDRGDMRVTLLSTRFEGPGASVLVSITETRVSGPFGANENSYEDSFALVRRQDSWAIDTVPWPLLTCTDAAVN